MGQGSVLSLIMFCFVGSLNELSFIGETMLLVLKERGAH